MSRNLQDQKRRYEERRLPEPRMSSAHVSDPAYYDSRTANNNGWHVQRPFDELQPYEGEDRPDYLDSPTLRPMRSLHPPQGSRRPTTPLDDRNTERSVQNTRHFSRSEERAFEHHAPRDHESRETRRSEEFREMRRLGRSSGNSGMGVKKSFPTPKPYSREDDQKIIDHVKKGENWQQIASKLDHTKQSVKQHWNRRLRFDERAKGIEYAFTHS